jgi:hypothetical protein
LQENKLELQGTLAMVQRKMRLVKLKDIDVEQLNPGVGVVSTGLALWQSELDFMPEDELTIINERLALLSPTGSYSRLTLYT